MILVFLTHRNYIFYCCYVQRKLPQYSFLSILCCLCAALDFTFCDIKKTLPYPLWKHIHNMFIVIYRYNTSFFSPVHFQSLPLSFPFFVFILTSLVAISPLINVTHVTSDFCFFLCVCDASSLSLYSFQLKTLFSRLFSFLIFLILLIMLLFIVIQSYEPSFLHDNFLFCIGVTPSLHHQCSFCFLCQNLQWRYQTRLFP